MEPKQRIRILCVDDEPNVLEGIALNLRRRYDVLTAPGGAAGLELIKQNPDLAVVVSDMRMPGMDGATFLAQVRQALPDAVRMLLTGQADVNSTIAAVNEGQIFRFLTKPCPPAALLAAMEAAATQHRLVTSERVLLEQTLHGSIKALTDVLALTNPVSFGRATRIKQIVSDLADALELRERWQVEVAAMLSQLGYITLPAETVEKVYYGHALTEDEQRMVARVPAVTEQLLGNIPRLELVRDILAAFTRGARPTPAGPDPRHKEVARGAQMLLVAMDFDVLEAQGSAPAHALGVLRGRAERYDPAVLAALAKARDTAGTRDEVREVPLTGLRVGMVLAEDLKMKTGVLLVARGYEVTHGFIERARNYPTGSVKEPVRVVLRAGAS